MDERTYETVIKILAEKINLLGWQLKVSEEQNEKLKKEKDELGYKLRKATEGENENV